MLLFVFYQYWPILILSWVQSVSSGDQYEVSNIICSDGESKGKGQRLEAKLKKPNDFNGYPFFADDRLAQPSTDPECQIRPVSSNPNDLVYHLKIKNFNRCGVKKQKGFTTVRVWFPKLPGLVLMTDQEVVIMCRPTMSTVTENRAAGISGSIPQQGRISGIVEEGSSRPEYSVNIYREATARSGNYVMPVEQAVPIGTRLQLKASINTNSVWKFAKLIEVTVSTDPSNGYQPGFIFLLQEGCRNQEYHSIVPYQPHRSPETPGEVTLEFEAFLLESMAPTDVLWIHTRIKACAKSNDCQPSTCMDLNQPLGVGRKRRHISSANSSITTSSPPPSTTTNEKKPQSLANFSQNVGIKIVPAGDYFQPTEHLSEVVHCNFLLMITIVTGSLLMTSVVTVIILSCRIHAHLKSEKNMNYSTELFATEWRHSKIRQQPTRSKHHNT